MAVGPVPLVHGGLRIGLGRSRCRYGGGDMKADVGDHIVVCDRHLDHPTREGEVVGVEHSDGSPPCRVRWPEGGCVTPFPARGAVVKHASSRTR
ncbi:DUF1918 domain-containing protein [Actinophytocola sp.]|uniref:DUF1918 domain-containing protein n=1 Tax=Actinophytocola sp. TaxID=1872138 RepID=UPI0039C8B282